MTPEEIVAGALQEVGNLAIGEVAQAEDVAYCTGKLNKLLRELDADGALHSQRREASIAYSTSGTVTMATDYGRYLSIVRVDPVTGYEHPMSILPIEVYENRLTNKAATGEPREIYKKGDGTWQLYPIPEATGTLTARYTREIPVSVAATDLELSTGWGDALTTGLAWEISRIYGLSDAHRGELWNRWRMEKRRMMTVDLPEGHIEITVDD